MYYAFVPGISVMQLYLTGSTDNYPRFRKYCEAMTELHVENIMPIVEYDTVDECLDAMKIVLNEFPNYGDYEEIAYVVDTSELITVGDDWADNVVVTTSVMYDRFREVVFNELEVSKMMHQLYSLVSSYALKVFSYMRISPDVDTLNRLMARLREIWDEYGGLWKNAGSFELMRNDPNSPTKNMRIWSLFSEASYLRLWLEIEIKSMHFGVPRSCMVFDYQDY